MIGIVIVTHSHLGDALIDAAEFIIGTRPDNMVSVSINLNENVDKLREKIAQGIKKVDQKKGVLILTKLELGEFAESLEAFGKKSISLASGILKGNKRK